MENISINFRDQFCTDIHRKVREIYSRWHNLLESDLKDCDDNKRLKYIDTKRIELRNKLFESKFKENFNLSELNTNINGCLEKYFKGLDISQAIGAEYFEFTNLGESKYDLESRKITVYPLKQLFTSKSYFKFSDLDRFKTVMEYISWGLSYLELNRLFDYYNGLQIYFQAEEHSKSNFLPEEALNEIKRKYLSAQQMNDPNSDPIAEYTEPIELIKAIPLPDMDNKANIHIPMGEDTCFYGPQFWNDIQKGLEWRSKGDFEDLKNDLKLRDGNKEKLKYIKSKRNEILNYQNECNPDYRRYIPFAKINIDLNNCLDAYYSILPFSSALYVKYDEKMEYGKYKYDEYDLILTIPLTPNGYFSVEIFNFCNFDEFEPLLEYLRKGKLYLELNRLKKELKEGKIVDKGKALSENDVSEENSEAFITINTKDSHKVPKENSQPATSIELQVGKIEDLGKEISTSENKTIQSNKLEVNKQEDILDSLMKKLTQEQIALILIYEEIKNINWQDIATKYGFKAKGSAVKISQHYNKLQLTIDRQGEQANPTKTKIRHNIAKIEGILPYLTSDNARKRANEDIKVTEKLYKEFLNK